MNFEFTVSDLNKSFGKFFRDQGIKITYQAFGLDEQEYMCIHNIIQIGVIKGHGLLDAHPLIGALSGPFTFMECDVKKFMKFIGISYELLIRYELYLRAHYNLKETLCNEMDSLEAVLEGDGIVPPSLTEGNLVEKMLLYNCVRDTWQGAYTITEQCKSLAAKKIQRAWRKQISSPYSRVGRNRLLREFRNMPTV